MKSKICFLCKQEKDISFFYFQKNKPRSYCKECEIKRSIEWGDKNLDRRREIRRNFYHRNKKEIILQQKQYYLKNKEYIVERERKKRHLNPSLYARKKREEIWHKWGGSYELFDKLLILQDNKCDICKMNFSSTNKPQFDHDHSKMKARGLLCVRCNTNLPFIEDEEFVNSAILYLKKHSEVQNKESV